MEIKRFRNKYNLELIPASHENIILGNLVWDPIIGKPKFDHPGMSEHIYNAFLDAEMVASEYSRAAYAPAHCTYAPVAEYLSITCAADTLYDSYGQRHGLLGAGAAKVVIHP